MNDSVRNVVASYNEKEMRGIGTPVSIETRFSAPTIRERILSDWGGVMPPEQVCNLWLESNGMKLHYRDGMYGLWVYGSADSRAATSEVLSYDDEMIDTDIVVGAFQGCDELLLYSLLDGWMVSTGIEVRSEWLRLGDDLVDFLIAFRDGGTEGDWRRSFIDA